MDNMGSGKVLAAKPPHPFPCPGVLPSLAAPSDHPEPIPGHFIDETPDAFAVASFHLKST